MAIMAPQNAPETRSEASPPDSIPSVAPTDFEATVPPSGMERRRGVVAGLILIGLGVAALCATWLPASGAWLFLGLGCAFLLARILTGRSGYAVPSGVLLGFGTFIFLTESG